MAFTSVRASDKYEDTASGVSTAVFNPSADIEIGDTIVLDYTTNVVHTVSSCADNSTQAGTANVYTIGTARTGTVCSFGFCYCLKATRRILTTDTITITFSATSTRRAGHLLVLVSSNGNPRFESSAGVTNDTASPVPMSATGTLYTANCAAVLGWGWKGAGVLSGYAQTVPTVSGGWVAHPSGAAASGGATTSVESNVTYNLNIGATTTFTPNATYTSISVGHGEALIFSDEVIDGRVPAVRQVGAVGGGAFGGGLNPNLPSAAQTDDLMLLFITLEESSVLTSGIPPTNWNSVGTAVSVTGGGILYAFWRQWDTSFTAPGLTWTNAGDGGETQMVCVHADTWDLTTPFEIYHTSSEATVDTSFSYAPGTSTTINNCLCWVTWTSGFDLGSGQGSGTATNASLTNIIGRLNGQTAGGLGAGFVGASGTKATAGTTGTWAQTALNATAKAYHSFAIRPRLPAAAAARSTIVNVARVWAGR